MNGRYYTADRGDIVDFLNAHGPFDRALDIGCAAGRLGRQLQEAGIVDSCDGIEPHPVAATMASSQIQRVWNSDLAGALSQVPWLDYDLFILADVLEHLIDPWQTLRDIHDRARPGARLMVSVPNVRHKSVVFPLLFQGRFDYVDAGIMDRTHLHFFTPGSLRAMVEASGWRVRAESLNIKKKYRKWWFPHRLLGPFLAVQCFLLAEK
jgi:2-polyprenyl-3-methyl-5-hydroxy-6-metoxy-1,4-benzoquinol methylase